MMVVYCSERERLTRPLPRGFSGWKVSGISSRDLHTSHLPNPIAFFLKKFNSAASFPRPFGPKTWGTSVEHSLINKFWREEAMSSYYKN